MASRIALAGIFLVMGVLVGAGGYAAYRGDLGSGRAVEEVPGAQAAQPLPESPSEEARAEPEELPKLPISSNYYENRRGRGYVVQVHNQFQKHLAVLVELENPTLEQEHEGSLQLGPGEMREIGEAQGWTFVSGETIRVKQDGYEDASLTIP